MPPSVLLVDDDEDFRRLARLLLAARGIVVTADAATGDAALEAVGRLRPDGVLLDVGLPDRDGLSVSRAIARTSHPPTVVLTSCAALAPSDAALAACGARAFVSKERLVEADLPGLFTPAGSGGRRPPVGAGRRRTGRARAW